MIVAIDGPAGSGKSTTARALAERLGFLYLDTGAMYRSAALRFLQLELEPTSENARTVLDSLDLDIRHGRAGLSFIMNGEDVSAAIRTPEVTDMSSRVSMLKEIREKMVEIQRQIAGKKESDGMGVIVEGRDIGTVVFPAASIKIFLEASSAERAKRRLAEFSAKGENVDQETVEKDMNERDLRDKNRELSPLTAAEDAIRIDSTELSLEQQINAVESIIRERMV